MARGLKIQIITCFGVMLRELAQKGAMERSQSIDHGVILGDRIR